MSRVGILLLTASLASAFMLSRSPSLGVRVADAAPRMCAKDARPAACPGGGAAFCIEGEWRCKPLPHKTCAPADRPAACPGGEPAFCTDGAWRCKPLPRDRQ